MRFTKQTTIGLALVLGFILFAFIATKTCNAQTVQYKGWQYDAQTQVLTLTFDFPMETVKTLQLAGGLNDAKAIADKMGKQAAKGFNNIVSEASESKKGKLAQWFDAKATAAQKAAFEAWVDTVGTFERNNPVLPPTEGVLVPQQQGWMNSPTLAGLGIGKTLSPRMEFLDGVSEVAPRPFPVSDLTPESLFGELMWPYGVIAIVFGTLLIVAIAT